MSRLDHWKLNPLVESWYANELPESYLAVNLSSNDIMCISFQSNGKQAARLSGAAEGISLKRTRLSWKIERHIDVSAFGASLKKSSSIY